MKRITTLVCAFLLSIAMVLPGLAPQPALAGGGAFSFSVAATSPPTRIVAVGDNGTHETAAVIDIGNRTEEEYPIPIKTIVVKRDGGRDSDFGLISLWDGNAQIGTDQLLTNSEVVFNLRPENPLLVNRATVKTLSIRANLNGISNGSVSGDSPKLGIVKITAAFPSNGQEFSIEPTNIYGNAMVLRKSKPVIAAASLPSTALSTGEKTLYRDTITADTKGDVSWRTRAFSMTGEIYVGQNTFVIGSKTEIPAWTDAIYMQSSNGTLEKLILSGSLRLFNVQTGEPIEGGFRIWNLPDRAVVQFIASANQTILAGKTETYELRGEALYGRGIISTKIPEGTVIPDNPYTDRVSFTWSDGVATATDYLVPGIPTATLSLTNGEPPIQPSIVRVTAMLDGEPWDGPVIFDISRNENFDGMDATGQFQVPQNFVGLYSDLPGGANIYIRLRQPEGFQSGPETAYLYGIAAVSSNGVSGESDGSWIGPYATPVTFTFVFKTLPSITVISPNGGEKWEMEREYEITWKATGIKTVDIYLENWEGLPAGGPLTWRLSYDVPVTVGKVSWTPNKNILPKINPGDHYRIRIVDYDTDQKSSPLPQVADSSDGYFSIVTPAPPPPPSVPETKIYLVAPAEVIAGDNFAAEVRVDNISNFDACNYNIIFDPQKLKLESVSGNSTVPINAARELMPGQWVFVHNIPGVAGLSGSGIMVKLNFRATGQGETQINFANGVLSSTQAKEIPAVWRGTAVIVKAGENQGLIQSLQAQIAALQAQINSLLQQLQQLMQWKKGDLNNDGQVNILDVTFLEKIVAGSQ